MDGPLSGAGHAVERVADGLMPGTPPTSVGR